jgi:hypothetical protein
MEALHAVALETSAALSGSAAAFPKQASKLTGLVSGSLMASRCLASATVCCSASALVDSIFRCC